MANTQRTINDLYDLLPDNTSGDISPQDVRDVVETLRLGWGGLSISASAETTIAVIDTYVKIAGTTTLGPARKWTSPQAGRLLFGGTSSRVMFVLAAISFTSVSNNQDIHFKIAKNGVVIDASEQHRVASVSDIGAVSLHCLDTISNGDYIEVWGTNATSTGNIEAEEMNLLVFDVAVG